MTRYKQIAEDLIARIRSGRPQLGARLPGELQLMRDYGASRHTIREALRRLEDLGLVERRRGRGTRVIARSAQRSYVHRVASPEELLQYPAESRLVVQQVGSVAARGTLAEAMGCAPGSRWTRVRTLRRMGPGRPPICRTDVYLRPAQAAIAGAIGRGGQAVYEVLEARYGLHVAEVAVDAGACPMPADAAALLGVEPESPSMLVVRRYLDERGRVLLVSMSHHPGDRYAFSQRLRRAWAPGAAGWAPVPAARKQEGPGG